MYMVEKLVVKKLISQEICDVIRIKSIVRIDNTLRIYKKSP